MVGVREGIVSVYMVYMVGIWNVWNDMRMGGMIEQSKFEQNKLKLYNELATQCPIVSQPSRGIASSI